MPQPKKHPPASAAARIAALAATGATVVGIASEFRIAKETLARWLDEHPALREAFDIGRERERMELHGMLYRLATEEKHAVAAMFLLKSRHAYREGDQSEQANRVQITFQLPGAMTMEQFKATVIDHADDRDQRLPAPRTIAARRG